MRERQQERKIGIGNRNPIAGQIDNYKIAGFVKTDLSAQFVDAANRNDESLVNAVRLLVGENLRNGRSLCRRWC